MKKILNLVGFFLLINLFIGCASKTVDIQPKEVSQKKMEKFTSYSCNQIDNALAFLEKKAQRVARVQNDNANSDKVLLSWGWIFYGVPYLFLDGNGEAKEQFEIILGEKEALEGLAIEKDCQFNRKSIHHTYDGDY
ncbi:hypothetical protein GA417_05340 [Poseidonibacter ostreae]|mgnify:CR=1 FL=1|uniref:hypothetical protein n=1 Tax=Poseidonibacter ostreae TaxID=2654171 RepID=UPI0012645008|nr:hypothetical protein [Poseidonibacter ostreae]KAB7886563.1 hypothetical protein GA417_05340 [Poseidonibacter ostreae]